jgi:hypothetical protein
MNFSQRKIRFLSRLLLVAGLFVQGILAAHACVTHESSAVKALSMQTDSVSCHEEETASANECLMHCTQSGQISLDLQQVAVPISNIVVLHVAELQPQRNVPSLTHASLTLNNGPPLTIRFCSFLI